MKCGAADPKYIPLPAAGNWTMPGGTYTLIIERQAGASITVGALGERMFPAGWYAYTGSALGSGGFARVERHRRTARSEHDVRHWHIDYLLGESATALDRVVTSEGVDAECAIAGRIEGEGVAGFGCSDCGCHSHLVHATSRAALVESVDRAHQIARG
jgi:endonuclease-3